MVRGVIDDDVIAGLEETHLANLFGADPGSSDVGHRAGRKLQPRVRGVDTISDNGNPNRVQTDDLDVFADQPLNYIKIVNHQVQDHIDVQRTSSELANAMNLEIDWIAHVRAQRHQRRIKSLGMADL